MGWRSTRAPSARRLPTALDAFPRCAPRSSWSGHGSGWDLGYTISVLMLLAMLKQLGTGPDGGWSVGQLVHRVQNMDFFQMMMFANLLQQASPLARSCASCHPPPGVCL